MTSSVSGVSAARMPRPRRGKYAESSLAVAMSSICTERPSLARLDRSELAVPRHGKSIALSSVALLEATAKPALTLLARTVRVVGGVRVAERVVADGVRRVHGLTQIVVGDLERRARGVSPDTRQAVGLELDANRCLVFGIAFRTNVRRA